MDGLPLPIQHLIAYYAITALAVGLASGALDALLEGPATGAELADRAGLDERNTEVWLRAMAANGHATREGDKYAASETLAMILSPAFPNDFRAVLDLVHANFAPRVHAATDAMRTGRGFGWEQWAAVGDLVGRLNSPTYRRALVDEWIAATRGT